ncbi:MAG: zinc-binding dehydrogenase [Lentisphaeria bacterium]|jgi:threonine dehydrogenase-like Zn-dependent dehydrogenase
MNKDKSAQALVFCSPARQFELRRYPLLAPGPGQVGLRLFQSGICGTDMHFLHGTLTLPPGELILGHEFIGRIDAIGEGADYDAIGQKICCDDFAIVCVAIPCGDCANCQRGETSSCMNFGVTYKQSPADPPHLHGGFAEYQFAPAANIVRLPAAVDPVAVSAFPCAGPTLIRAAKYSGGFQADEFVVVQGTGAMGLFAIAFAAAAGCRVVAVGSMTNSERSELARAFGAEQIFDYRADRDERVKAIRELSGGVGADVVIETSGTPDSFVEGLDLLRIRGRYLVPGQYSNSGAISILPQLITFKALQIFGSGQYNLRDVKDYLDFVLTHANLVEFFRRCTAARYTLDYHAAAFAAVEAGEAIKAVFVNPAESMS